jgi:hypothetical protein
MGLEAPGAFILFGLKNCFFDKYLIKFEEILAYLKNI